LEHYTNELASASTNFTESLFFRLPPELRNRIYTLLFGNRTIHIREKQLGDPADVPNVELSFCTVQHDQVEVEIYTLEGHKYKPLKSYDGLHHAYVDHPWSWPPPDPRLFRTLQFLGVCRQIYQEAALIPFATNTFCFHDIGSMRRFTKSLMPRHARAITSVILAISGYERGNIGLPMLSRLGGLRDLTFILDGSALPYKPSNCVRLFNLGLDIFRLSALTALSAAKVKIQPALEQWIVELGTETEVIALLQLWAEGKEAQLLQDPEVYHQEEARKKAQWMGKANLQRQARRTERGLRTMRL